MERSLPLTDVCVCVCTSYECVNGWVCVCVCVCCEWMERCAAEKRAVTSPLSAQYLCAMQYFLIFDRPDSWEKMNRQIWSHTSEQRQVWSHTSEHEKQGGEDSQDPLSCRSFPTKEPLNIGHFCGKWPIKIRDPMSLRHTLYSYSWHEWFTCVTCHMCDMWSDVTLLYILIGPIDSGETWEIWSHTSENMKFEVTFHQIWSHTSKCVMSHVRMGASHIHKCPCAIWCTHKCDLTHPCMFATIRSHVWHDSSNICDMTHYITHSQVWLDSSIYLPWFIHVCDMTHSYVWLDTL